MSDKRSKCSSCFWRTESTHKGCLCRQNVLKAFPRQQAGGSTKSSTLGHCTCTCGLQGILHLGSELLNRENLPHGLPGHGCGEGQPRLQHTTFSPTQAESGPSRAINLSSAFYIPSHSSALCFQCFLFRFSKRRSTTLGNPVAFLSLPYLAFSVASKPDPT